MRKSLPKRDQLLLRIGAAKKEAGRAFGFVLKSRSKKELLDELLKDYQKPEDILGENGLLKQFTKAILERALGAELTQHLGYERHDPAGYGSGNSRNGTTEKTRFMAGRVSLFPEWPLSMYSPSICQPRAAAYTRNCCSCCEQSWSMVETRA